MTCLNKDSIEAAIHRIAHQSNKKYQQMIEFQEKQRLRENFDRI